MRVTAASIYAASQRPRVCHGAARSPRRAIFDQRGTSSPSDTLSYSVSPTIGGLMKTATRAVAALVVVLVILFAARTWRRTAGSRNDVSRAQPGTVWRGAGGIGAQSATPTVAGV